MFLFVCFCLYILLEPYYIFPSGLPQLSDFILLLTIGYSITKAEFWKLFSLNTVRLLMIFLFIVIGVNFIYFFKGLIYNEKVEFIMPILYYLFNCLAFVSTLFIFKNISIKQQNIILSCIIVTLIIQCILAFIGFSKGLNVSGGRAVIFFNNPNQLGYYVLLSLIVSLLLIKDYTKKNKVLVTFLLFISLYLVILSGSRAAFIGILSLTIYIVIKESIAPLKILQGILILLVVGGIFIITNKDIIDDAINTYEMRQSRDSNRNFSESENRGYDRLLKYPEYIFYGAGEDAYYRFSDSHHQGEIHSGFGTILFCYGIAGLVSFMAFIYNGIKYNFRKDIFILFPILLYNITHQGIRQSLFWIILALIYYNNIRYYNETKPYSYNNSSIIIR